MKTHNNNFKSKIYLAGRELEDKITYQLGNKEIILSSEDLNTISPNYEGGILKSVMKQLDIDSNIDIPKGTTINYKLGVKVDSYEYLNYGNYIVHSSEKNEDTNSYSILCYDKMLYSMVDYEDLGISYPITIRNFIIAMCNRLGLAFANYEKEFVNSEKIIDKELYADLGYKYRDVLDELAQATASTICINENDELEIRYIHETNDIINKEYFKDTNVKFGKKYGPLNSVVLSRSAESDSIYLRDEESVTKNGLCEIKITDNQIMNWNNRDEFLPEILNKLNGLEYFLTDFMSTGICYYDLCDKYTVEIDGVQYSCIMFNDEVKRDDGLEEYVFSDILPESVTDYSKADKTDRRINQAILIVDKQQKIIEGLVTDMYEEDGVINEKFTQAYQDIDGFIKSIQNSGGSNLIYNSVMFAIQDGVPENWTVTGVGALIAQSSPEAFNNGAQSGHTFTLLDKKVKQRVYVKPDEDSISDERKTYYTFSCKIKKNLTGTCYVKLSNSVEEHIIQLDSGQESFYGDYEIKALLPKENYYDIEFYGSQESNATFTDVMFALGQYKTTWTQANGEIMNTQVVISQNGVLVKSSVYEGDYTVMSPLEFAGYSLINGVITKVFSLNKDTTNVKKMRVEDEIAMSPIKIVPILKGDVTGWALVKTGSDN